MKKKIALLVYYLFARWFPTQPMPGWRLGYAVRRFLFQFIVDEVGPGVIVKHNAYIGNGEGLRIGSNSQIGQNCRIGKDVTIGDDVVMGPDVVIMTASHAFDDLDTPIRLQGADMSRPIRIGNDVWIGTRVIILPGVNIGNKSVIGAGSVVTKDIPEGVVAAGVPARVVRRRGDSQARGRRSP